MFFLSYFGTRSNHVVFAPAVHIDLAIYPKEKYKLKTKSMTQVHTTTTKALLVEPVEHCAAMAAVGRREVGS